MSAKVEVRDEAILMTRVVCEHNCQIGPNHGLFFSAFEAADRAEEHRKKHRCAGLTEGQFIHDEDYVCNVRNCLDGELMITIDEP